MSDIFKLLIILILLSLTGCKTKEHIVYKDRFVTVRDTVERVRTDSVITERVTVHRDSIRVRDSVSVTTDAQGNTTTDRWHWTYQFQSENARVHALEIENTVLRERFDSIAGSVTTETTVYEKPLTWWQRFRLNAFIPLSATLVLLILIFTIYIRFMFRRGYS